MELFSIDLLDDVTGIKFLNEIKNGKRNLICLDFEYIEGKVVNDIKILVEENEYNCIVLYVMYENVCKDIDISDSIMQNIIEQTTKIYNKIRRKIIQSRINVKIESDTMSIENNIYEKYTDKEKSNYIIKLYDKIKNDNIEDYNYVNRLIVFGVTGKEVAERIQDLGIAKVQKSRGGYLIDFTDSINNRSNIFINKFAEEINKVGIPCLSMPLIVIDYFWTV